jgi:hypothetical protein
MVFVPCKWFTNKIIQVSMILFSDALNHSPCVPFFDFVCLFVVCCQLFAAGRHFLRFSTQIIMTAMITINIKYGACHHWCCEFDSRTNRARCTTLCDTYCLWLAVGRWFSLGIPVPPTNKTDRNVIAEKLLKVALHPIKPNYIWIYIMKVALIISWFNSINLNKLNISASISLRRVHFSKLNNNFTFPW